MIQTTIYLLFANRSRHAIGLLTKPWSPGQYIGDLDVKSASVWVGCLVPLWCWKYDAIPAAAAIPAAVILVNVRWSAAGLDSIWSMPCGLPDPVLDFISVIECSAANGGLVDDISRKLLNTGVIMLDCEDLLESCESVDSLWRSVQEAVIGSTKWGNLVKSILTDSSRLVFRLGKICVRSLVADDGWCAVAAQRSWVYLGVGTSRCGYQLVYPIISRQSVDNKINETEIAKLKKIIKLRQVAHVILFQKKNEKKNEEKMVKRPKTLLIIVSPEKKSR